MVDSVDPQAIANGLCKLELDPHREDQSNTALYISPKPPTLLTALAPYPIFNALCSFLDIGGLITLQQISKQFEGSLAAHKKERWNVNKRLARFFQDPVSLRSMLGRHDALISGSFVIQFLDGVLWKESDLDIYVEEGWNAKAMDRHLVEREGYTLNKSAEAETTGYDATSILRTNTYTRRSSSREEIKVQLVCVDNIPIHAILSGFYASHVVNVMSWNKVYSLFPEFTFIRREMFDLADTNEISTKNKAKYSERGWMSVRVMRREVEKPSHSIRTSTSRNVGDKKTWILLLDVSGLQTPETPDFVLENAHFSIQYALPMPRYKNESCYLIDASPVESCVLKYRYTLSDSVEIDFMQSYISRRLDALTLCQLHKVKPSDLPHELRGQNPPKSDLWVFNYNFEKPPTWTYYDDLLPLWLEEYNNRAVDWRRTAQGELERSLEK